MLTAPFILPLLGPVGAVQAQTPSALWGEDGAAWTPQSRLPDFSFAGYRSGEAPLPVPPVSANVRDFGARGDGETDDTQAFVKALESTEKGAIWIPAGRYKLTDILTISKSGIVLRGEGPDKTVLFYPKAIGEIKPVQSATTTGQATSAYSWSGGFITVSGKPVVAPGTKPRPQADLGMVAAIAERGARELELTAPAAIVPGQRIEIVQTDPADKSFVNYLYGGQPGDAKNLGWARTPFVSRVTAVNGTRITLERPLRLQVNPAWKAVVRPYNPLVTEVGIEHLAFEFPPVPYGGHFKETGFNPISMGAVADCWVRNIRLLNADSGPFLSGNFITVQQMVVEANRPADATGCTGHHGMTLGTDNLFTDFDFRTRFVHDISVENSAGSVAANGKGVDLCFDHHKRHPHANLFTNIDIGLGTRMYRSGGGGGLGRNSGAWTTFWNIRSARPQNWPWASAEAGFGPDLMNLVGVESKAAAQMVPEGRWFEPIAPAQLTPQNLYEAQLARRLKTAR